MQLAIIAVVAHKWRGIKSRAYLFYMSLTLPPELLLLATCYLLPPTLDNARLILHL